MGTLLKTILWGAAGGVAAVAILNRTAFGKQLLGTAVAA